MLLRMSEAKNLVRQFFSDLKRKESWSIPYCCDYRHVFRAESMGGGAKCRNRGIPSTTNFLLLARSWNQNDHTQALHSRCCSCPQRPDKLCCCADEATTALEWHGLRPMRFSSNHECVMMFHATNNMRELVLDVGWSKRPAHLMKQFSLLEFMVVLSLATCCGGSWSENFKDVIVVCAHIFQQSDPWVTHNNPNFVLIICFSCNSFQTCIPTKPKWRMTTTKSQSPTCWFVLCIPVLF